MLMMCDLVPRQNIGEDFTSHGHPYLMVNKCRTEDYYRCDGTRTTSNWKLVLKYVYYDIQKRMCYYCLPLKYLWSNNFS